MEQHNEKLQNAVELRKKILLDYLPMGITFVGIIVCAILFKQQVVKTLPVCISLIVMLFNARANRFGFLLGAANSMIYIVGYFSERLYGTVISTVIGAILQLISFFQWKRRSYKGTSTHFRTLKTVWRILCALGILLVWAVTSYVLKLSGANQVIWDGLCLVLGFVLPVADMFAVIDAIPFKIFNVVGGLIMWILLVVEGNIANITYVIISLYNLYMIIRQSLRWIALYKEQQALKNTAENNE